MEFSNSGFCLRIWCADTSNCVGYIELFGTKKLFAYALCAIISVLWDIFFHCCEKYSRVVILWWDMLSLARVW